jgi:hypothetical protein
VGARFVSIANNYTGTFPMVLHEPGRKRRLKYLPALSASILSRTWPSAGCPEELTVMTWSNAAEPTLLERTCERLGLPIKVYGKQVANWDNYQKLLLSYQACCEERSKYIMGVDARDAIILAPPQSILAEFIATRSKMLFGCEPRFAYNELTSGELKSFFDALPGATDTPVRYLNSGQWIAERELARSLFKAALDLNLWQLGTRRDQSWIAYAMLRSKDLRNAIALDYECRVFQVHIADLPDDYVTLHAMGVKALSVREREKRFASLTRAVAAGAMRRRRMRNRTRMLRETLMKWKERSPGLYGWLKRQKDRVVTEIKDPSDRGIRARDEGPERT